jgi:hypothetical protein
MRRYLPAVALTIVLISPAFAEEFWVIYDLPYGGCEVRPTSHLPSDLDEGQWVTQAGPYDSEEKAQEVMKTFEACKSIFVARDKETGLCHLRTPTHSKEDERYQIISKHWKVAEAEKALEALDSSGACKKEPGL